MVVLVILEVVEAAIAKFVDSSSVVSEVGDASVPD
jgi:hypothetical protein